MGKTVNCRLGNQVPALDKERFVFQKCLHLQSSREFIFFRGYKQ
jgi:hypothetical protein